MVKEQNYGYSFSPFRFVLIPPSASLVAPVSGGQLVSTASLLAKQFSVVLSP